jgi:uncharacterized protein (TIGR00159 family)
VGPKSAGGRPSKNEAKTRWQSLVDFVVLATAIYLLLLWGREARALRAFLMILSLRVGALLGRQLDLPITAWVLDTGSVVTLVLMLVVFQGELRRAFTRLELVVRLLRPGANVLMPELQTVGQAVFGLAGARRGALVVIARSDSLDGLIGGGVPLGGEVSVEILETIFRKVSPVHDGAAVIQGSRISWVAAILPLTESEAVPSGYGTRHRAAMGLAERCDAVIVAVSEERGTVTLFHGAEAQEFQKPEDLVRQLERLVGPPADKPRLRKLIAHPGLMAGAIALAFAIWTPLWLGSGTAVRSVVAPVELSHVPPGLKVARLSSPSVEAHLRGSPWVLDSLGVFRVVARVDLAGRGEGLHQIALDSRAFNLPPGLTLEGTAPERVEVELARSVDGLPAERERP